MAVHVKHDPYRVVAASSTRHPELTAKRPPARALERFKEIDEPTLASLLGLKPGSKARQVAEDHREAAGRLPVRGGETQAGR